MRTYIVSAILALGLAGCATTGTEISRSEAVTSACTIIGFGGGGKTSVSLATRATRHEGKVAICAAMGENRSTSFSFESVNYLKNGAAFFLDGDRVMASVPFAPVYEGVDQLRGKRAKCAVTETPWKPGYAGKRVKITVKRGYIGS